MFALILSMTLWGTLGAFVLWSGLPALDVAFYRCVIGVIVLSTWFIGKRERVQFDKSTMLITIAGICLVANWIFLFKSFQVSTITIGNMSYYLQPIMLMILGALFYKEQITIRQWLLIFIALTGVLITVDVHNLQSPHMLLGIMFALVAALLYSFVTLLMKPIQMNHFKVIFMQLVIGIIMLVPFVQFHAISTTAVACLLVIGLVHTVFAYYLYYKAIKTVSFAKIAIVSYIDPIVAIATDVAFFHRHLGVLQYIGIAVTFSALYYLISYGKNKAISNEVATADGV